MRLLTAVPLAGLAPLNLTRFGPEFLQVRNGLDADKLFRVDDNVFWAGKEQRADIRQRIRKTFQTNSTGNNTFDMTLMVGMPQMSEKDGQTTMRFDTTLRYRDETLDRMQYVLECQLVMVARDSDAEQSPSAWRIEAIEVISGRVPSERSNEGRPRAPEPPADPAMIPGLKG